MVKVEIASGKPPTLLPEQRRQFRRCQEKMGHGKLSGLASSGYLSSDYVSYSPQLKREP